MHCRSSGVAPRGNDNLERFALRSVQIGENPCGFSCAPRQLYRRSVKRGEKMTALAGWENFYVVVGSSAGALIGLQFVVITLLAGMPIIKDVERASSAFRQLSFISLWHCWCQLPLALHGTPLPEQQLSGERWACLVSCMSRLWRGGFDRKLPILPNSKTYCFTSCCPLWRMQCWSDPPWSGALVVTMHSLLSQRRR